MPNKFGRSSSRAVGMDAIHHSEQRSSIAGDQRRHHIVAMPIEKSRLLNLAAIDQLMIKREMNIAALEQEVAECKIAGVSRPSIDTWIETSNAALRRLEKQRRDIIDRQR